MAPDVERPMTTSEEETQLLWQLPESLLEFVNTGDGEMVAEILSLFQQDTATRLQELNLALAGGDRETVRKQAHTLKGASLQVGAMALSGICLELEKQAKFGPEAQLRDLAYQAWECYGRTCREMLAANRK